MSTRKPMMAGNWKMHMNTMEAVELVDAINGALSQDTEVEVVVCPPFTALADVGFVLKSSGSKIVLGAQNMYWEDEGAFTGEISPLMLKQAAVEYVIIGHSERRQYFGETDETVNKKIRAALAHGLKPILCVGETLEQRESKETMEVIRRQIEVGLQDVGDHLADKLIIAYEPIWAIGTGRVAEPEDANDVIRHIRAVVGSKQGVEEAQSVRILYGGSVKPGNVKDIMEEPEIDGALVGGASLDGDSFMRLIDYQKTQETSP